MFCIDTIYKLLYVFKSSNVNFPFNFLCIIVMAEADQDVFHFALTLLFTKLYTFYVQILTLYILYSNS